MNFKSMSNIELIELYKEYVKKGFRSVEEQEILANLRAEILRRMERN